MRSIGTGTPSTPGWAPAAPSWSPIGGLATGEVNPDSPEQTRRLLLNEARVGLALAAILVLAGYVRVAAFQASAVGRHTPQHG